MADGGYSIERSPKHSWTIKDRLLLSLLSLFYLNSVQDFALIFSQFQRKELSREGFRKGMPGSSISSQLHEFKNGGTGSALYSKIAAFSKPELCAIFNTELKSIQAVAEKLRIDLCARDEHNIELTNPPSTRRRRQASIAPTDTSVTPWYSEESTAEEIETPSKRPKVHLYGINTNQMARTFLAPIVPLNQTITQEHRTPYFLYRTFELSHGFRARRFLSTQGRIPPPPRCRSRFFAQEVQPHLERDITYDSPFISMGQYPVSVVKHAFQKVADGKKIAFAIFRYEDLKKETLSRFGPETGPYLVPILCKQHELVDLPGGYTGNGEFLIWGSIECKPVVIIDAINILMIRAVLRTTDSLSFHAGMRVSRYMPILPNHEELELFLYQLVKGFKIGGHQAARKSQAYFEFIRGATTKTTQNYNNLSGSPQFLPVLPPERPLYPSVESNDVSQTYTGTPNWEFVTVLTPPNSGAVRRQRYAVSAWRSDSDDSSEW